MADRPALPESVFVHANALVETDQVGPGTRIWAFAHVLPGAVVGAECNVCDHTFIEGGATLGDRVTVKCGIYIWDGVTCEDDVFLGPNVVFTNDLMPRSRRQPDQYEPTLVRRGASIGANATVIAGTTIGEYAMVGAGAVITRDVAAYALVYGNPARQHGWVSAAGQKLAVVDGEAVCPESGIRYRVSDDRCEPVTDGS